MEKKRWGVSSRQRLRQSQVSVFIILGMLFLIFVILTLFMTETLYERTNAEQKMALQSRFDRNTLDSYVKYCILKSTPAILERLGIWGGTLNESELNLASVKFQGQDYRILCNYADGSKSCVNRVVTRQDMEREIAGEVLATLDNCIDLDYFSKQGYIIRKGEPSMDVIIGDESIGYFLKYPLSLSKDKVSVTADEFHAEENHPLGTLIKLALDILNREAGNGFFDKDKWMSEHNMLAEIDKKSPYPNVVYNLTFMGGKRYSFRFAISLEDKASQPLTSYSRDSVYGCCYIGGRCFKNSDFSTCNDKGGSYEPFADCLCRDNIVAQIALPGNDSPGNRLKDCTGMKDGEAVCRNEEGIGGRDVLKSCHDGKIFYEDCRDFREEVCIEYQEAGRKTAECKPNRWQDCASCRDRECCENDMVRDCQWSSNATYSQLLNRQSLACIPKLAPGFRFWEGAGEDVCGIGTGYAVCAGKNCPEGFMSEAAGVCSMLGDCGINSNYLGILTKSGYLSTDRQALQKSNPAEAYREAFISSNRMQESLMRQPASDAISLLPALISGLLRYLEDAEKKESTTLDFFFCNLWEQPYGGDCGKCNASLNGCSEYKCRSISQDCMYREKDGYPVCTRKTAGAEKTNISLSTEGLAEEMAYESNSVMIAGKTIQGYEIRKPLPPYKRLSFRITTGSMSKCKITYLPGLDFAASPAIWFGEPKYSTAHTATLRLPEKVSLPATLHAKLNASSMADLFGPVAAGDESIRELLNLTLSSLDNNTYYSFITCSDESGAGSQDMIYLKFTIGNSSHGSPPALIYAIPAIGSEVQPPYSFKAYLDEPSECRYSMNDVDYALMEGVMDCETDMMRPSYYGEGGYECSATSLGTARYMRCAGNPQILKRMLFRIESTGNEKGDYVIEGRQVYLSGENLFNTTTVSLNDSRTLYNITMSLFGNFTCKYSTASYDEKSMHEMECKTLSSPIIETNCSKEFASGEYSVYLICRSADAVTRTVNSESIDLGYVPSRSLEIISAFPKQGEISNGLVNSAVVVNRNIESAGVSCGYRADAEREFIQMEKQGTYMFARSIIMPGAGEHRIEFLCLDKQGEAAGRNVTVAVS